MLTKTCWAREKGDSSEDLSRWHVIQGGFGGPGPTPDIINPLPAPPKPKNGDKRKSVSSTWRTEP